MAERSDLQDFVAMCLHVGASSAFVQGGGGNISIKLQNDRMLVKASGTKLSEVSETAGYAEVDFKLIRRMLHEAELPEDAFNAKVISSNTLKSYRPSMETGFHAALGQCVVHSHSVYANVLTCSEEGESIINDLFPTATFITYVPPGLELAKQIFKHATSDIFFLANHGLIVQGKTKPECLRLHDHINETIQNHLQLPAFKLTTAWKNSIEFMHEHPLFPDQIVYTSEKASISKDHVRIAVLSAYDYIHNQIRDNHFRPRYLGRKDCTFLLNMEAEKFRAEMASQ